MMRDASYPRITVLVAAGWLSPWRRRPLPRSSVPAAPAAAGITPFRDAFRTDLGGGTVAGANGLVQRRHRRAARDQLGRRAGRVRGAQQPAGGLLQREQSPRRRLSHARDRTTSQRQRRQSQRVPDRVREHRPATRGNVRSVQPQRLFTAIGSTIVDVRFFVLGTTTPAFVRGFGAVFSDVDLGDQTRIAFFGPSDVSPRRVLRGASTG